MKTLTYADLLSIQSGLAEFLTVKTGGKLAAKLGRLRRQVAGPLEDFETGRTAIVDEQARKDDTGEKMTDKAGMVLFENVKEFEKQIRDLLKEEVEVDVDDLTEADLEALEGVTGEAFANVAPLFA